MSEEAIYWVMLVTVLLAIVGGAMVLGSYRCSSRSDAMRVDHTWGPIQGCMIRVHGDWIPIENYRVLD